MKLKLIKIFFVLLILILPFGRRHIFWSLNPMVANSWSPFATVAVFAVDILATILILLAAFNWKSLKNRSNSWILAFFAWNLLIFFFSPRETLYDTYLLVKTVELLAIFIVFAFVSRGGNALRPVFWAFLASGFLQSLIAIGQFATQSSLGLKILGETPINVSIQGIAKIQSGSQLLIRPYGTFDHPNQLAAFLVVACATTLYLLVVEKTKKAKALAAISLVVLSFAEFLTFSRAGIGALGIMFAIFIAVYFIEKRWGHELKSLLAIIFLSIIIPMVSLFPQLSSRATLIDNATLSRLEYDKVGLKILAEHPFTGVGPGNLIFSMAQKLPHTPSWAIQPPHNYFIAVACETGVEGLVLFIAALIYLIKKLIRRVREKGQKGDYEGAKLGLGLSLIISFIFLMMFDHYFYDLPQTELLLWVILGIITGIVSRETIISKP